MASVPIETIKSRGELIQDIEGFALFIMEHLEHDHSVQLTLERDSAIQLSSSLLQILALLRRQERAS